MKFNLFTFEPNSESFELNFFTEKIEDTHPIRVFQDEIPSLWENNPELDNEDTLFFSLIEPKSCIGRDFTHSLKYDKNRRIAKHYLSQNFYNILKKDDNGVCFDFVDNVEVWVKDTSYNNEKIARYNKFSLIPKHQLVSKYWELVVSFNGSSYVYKTPISQLDLQIDSFLVLAGNEIVKNKKLTPKQKQNIDNIFPVINSSLEKELNVTRPLTPRTNKYIRTQNLVLEFAREHLFANDNLLSLISFHTQGFYTFDNDSSYKVYDNSNQLLFANNTSNVVPYNGLSKSGPYKPSPYQNVRFFFIYQASLVKETLRLYNIFFSGINYSGKIESNEKRPFPSLTPLSNFIKQPFNTVSDLSISFEDLGTAIKDIKDGLHQKEFDKNVKYVAIYISPVDRDDVNSPYHKIYYTVKELLLEKGITSQVINVNNPSQASFRFHIPNIAAAILAKIDGIPWKLKNVEKNNDLVIGVGAFKSRLLGVRYIGSAFCFSQDGLFQNFDSYQEDDLQKLIGDIRAAIGSYISQNHDQAPKRLIIHYYKTMGQKESRKILNMLHTLGFNIPVIVVTINKTESHDIVAFDESFNDLMPISGTFVKVGYNTFLLYNNSKYSASDTKYDILFPVKIKVSKVVKDGTEEEKELSMSEVRQVLNQVYQFSRIYWKSVKQQNLPVTIKYPEMVAKIVPHFTESELPNFGKKNLWFL